TPGELQSPEPRYVYARSGARVWRYDLQERRSRVVASAPAGEDLKTFSATVGGHVVISTNIASPHQDKMYWVKPDGAVTPLNAANFDMGYPYSLPEGIVAGSTVLTPRDGGLEAVRLGYVKFGTSIAAWSIPTGKAGSWSTSPVFAID